MWKKALGLTAAVAALALVAGTWFGPQQANADTPASTEHTLTVSGTGTVSVAPDTAVVTLGFTSKAASADAVQNAGNTAMGNILDAVVAKGIKQDEIKTSQFSLSPNYVYDEKSHSNNLDGYSFTETLQVTVKDLKKVGTVIDAATGAGANRVDGISFTVSDPKAVQVNAIKAAADDAKAKGQAAAQQLGTTLGGVVKVDIGSMGTPGPVYYKAMAAEASAAVSPGTVDVGMTVTVTFKLP